jgi:hypothetical protein
LAAPSFSSLQYTTLALAKVWTNTAKLPSSRTMLALHEKTMEERGGYGKYALFFGPKRSSGKSFVACVILGLSIHSYYSSFYLSDRLAQRGGGQVWWQAGSFRLFSSDPRTDDAHPGRCSTEIVRRLLCVEMGTTHALNSTKEVSHYWQIALSGGPLRLTEKDDAVLESLGIIPTNGADQGRYEDAVFCDDYW